MPHFDFGPTLLEHAFLSSDLLLNTKMKDFSADNVSKIIEVVNSAKNMLENQKRYGIIIQKVESRPVVDGKEEDFKTFIEFHPYLFQQFKDKPIVEFDHFNTACDQFFSQLEAQKIELKTVQQEKAAVKKLENGK